ncbi:MAG TPA: nicotinate phosphoribosyltransferase, partial [Candidatus Dormibacteraeota bacterium]|nr:nicotinate phosphoribosyltransferase [Candidatus Dormibacteraeota bacterium]
EVDGFGVGTAMATSSDAPSIGLIYKLVEVRRNGRAIGVAKFSPGKATYPGPKQVFRLRDRSGQFTEDRIALAGERLARGEPLLLPAIRKGRRVCPAAPLGEARDRCRKHLLLLPERYRRIDRRAAFPVSYSPRLERMFEQMRRAALRRVR